MTGSRIRSTTGFALTLSGVAVSAGSRDPDQRHRGQSVVTVISYVNRSVILLNHKRFDITIHGIEPGIHHRLEARARRRCTSLNRVLTTILEEALGADPTARGNPFADLCGSLPGEAVAELLEREREFERVDPEAWL